MTMAEHTRRDFLALAALGAGSIAARAGQPGTPQPPEGETTPAGVAPETVEQAEKLAGIAFTPSERQQMVRSIGEQVSMLKARQAIGFLPNELAPADVFDPRPRGWQGPTGPSSLVRSAASVAEPPSSDEDLAYAPVSTLSRWIQARKLSSRRLTQVYLDRLKRLDGRLKAVVTLTGDLALKQAGAADDEIAAGRYRGPLHGIPWGAKDLFDTAGIRTTWGAEPYQDRIPSADATVVGRLASAGAVLVAKLSLGALAYGDQWFGGRTNNPWNTDRGSSGSSAGPAAGTAAGMVAFGLGTETYGSIVSPSLACGVTGLRPTFGRVSRRGAMALCWSLDKVGPICRTVEDCALVLSAIHGSDPGDPSSIDEPLHFDATAPVAGLKVGYDPAWFERRGAGESERTILDACRAAGLSLVEVEIPPWPYQTLLTILHCEAAAAFEELTRANQDDQLSWQAPQAWPNTFRQSWFIPGIELVQAQRFRRRVMDMMAERFAAIDAFIGGHTAGSLTLITNHTGHPSLTLRCGFRDNGMPTGVTLHGRLFDEGTLCRIGMALETQFAVWDRRPPL